MLIIAIGMNIMMPFGEIKPISCFFLTIAESGERKTSCDNVMLKTVRDYEEELRKENSVDLQAWENDCTTWKREYELILREQKSTNGSRDIIKSKLDALGAKPVSPLVPLIVCPDPTFEGLCKLMITSRPSLGIFSSEGGQFVGGYGMSADNKIRTAAALSEMWDGEPIKRVRGGDGTIILAGKRLSMHLMVQPNIGTNFLSDIALKDQGLCSRLLISYPLTTIGTRFQHEVKSESVEALTTFNQIIDKIFRLPLPIKDGCTNELNPRIINMEGQALNAYNEFSDHIEKELAPSKSLESIKGFANKLPEHAYRIAATFAAIDNIEVKQLDYQYIKMGIEIASYYGEEALRLFNNGVIDPDIILAEKLLDWLHNKWDEDYISLPDIYQRGLNAISTKATASKIVTILIDHGWLKKQDEPTLIKGKMRKNAFKIIKN
ncbi:YfjI family protein [Candidatus Trichorickettsia mobilis]|uniref:YfjI family protein n=1 Tax=Candidatus Trichorickettsia mobilis TaxID=1346319 RepID=UPI00292DC88B|nr:YfjI family protein [Candidatus Trichorickettsia mobilis]